MSTDADHTPNLGPPEYRRKLLLEMDKCVKCAACIPVCPSYRVKPREGYSPRGRIALVQGLISGELPVTEGGRTQLDACLSCLACERVCPSKVSLRPILDAGMTLSARPGIVRRWLRALSTRGLSGQAVTGRWLPALLGSLAWTQRLLPGVYGLERVQSPSVFPEWSSAAGKTRGRVALFLGCAARSLDQAALRDGLFLLNEWGFDVWVPPTQGCCGSLDLHEGDLDSALGNARQNQRAFGGEDFSALISTASGCGRMLAEYRRLPWQTGQERESADQWPAVVADISEFLLRNWPGDLHWRQEETLPVAVHTPCSLRNPRGAPETVARMLQSVPGLEVVQLADDNECCGAGALHRFTHRQQAERLAAPLVTAIRDSGARVLLSSNYGCAMHLENQLKRSGLELRVMHPVTLLRQRIKAKVEA